MRRFASRLLIVGLIAAIGASPAIASEEITIEGGGWGHGIGMSQHGAKAMADAGSSAGEIISHFYTGSTLGSVGVGALVGHADPLRIGLVQNALGVDFSAVNGPLTLCLGVDCTLSAQPDDVGIWSLRADGLGSCQFYLAEAPMGVTGACEASVSWVDQPNTRVDLPDLGRTYARGTLVFVPAPNNAFHTLVELGLEAYLYGLGEMPSSWHPEALKAQAIAGRTYALYKAWVHRDLENNQTQLDACGCHLYASTKDQSYIGWAKEAEGVNGFWGDKWVAAVDATTGTAVIHEASSWRAIQAFYFSSTGGATENNEDIWGGSPFPYLRSVNDPGFSLWEERLTRDQLADGLGFQTVFDAVITGTYVSGSPSAILFSGLKGGSSATEEFTGAEVRSALSLRSHNIKSLSGFLPSSFSVFVGGDFDGDGRGEVAGFSTVDGTWWVFDYAGGTLIGSQWADFSTSSGWSAQVVGDFDGDGKDDIANFHPSNGTWWVSRSTGSSFVTSLWADFSTPSGWGPQLVGDFNGDGRDDIANFHSSNGTWWVSKSTGSSLATSLWADFAPSSGWSPQLAGDFNGDGKDDIASFRSSNGTWWVSVSSGSGFGTSLWADFSTASGWSAQVVGDFNGDGRDDIANFHPSNGTWWVSKSSGSSLSTSLWADFTTVSGWDPQLVGDFNGDGKDDIANFHSSNGTWWVSSSNGAGFSTFLKGTVTPPSGWQGQLVGDFDGDGNDDLSNWNSASQTWVLR